MNTVLDETMICIKPRLHENESARPGHSRRQKLHCRRHDAPTVPEAARSMPMAHSPLSHSSVAIMESVTEWPYDKVLQLIMLFQQRPMLWDTRCDAYKDRQKRHEVTLELAAHFNVEKDEIERKLKNLQSHFYREIKKEEQTKSAGVGTTGIYRSKWFAYQAMRFLADKSKPRRTHVPAVGSKTPATRQKSTAARVSTVRHGDKSRLKKSEHEARNSPLRKTSPIKNENAASTIDDFLYIDTNQQGSVDNSQIDYWEEKPVSIGSQDPIEFATQMSGEAQQQQSQRTANFEDNRPNEKGPSTPCKQDVKTVISEDVIAPAIDFLLTEVKAHGSNDPELNFYRSLIPDIMKLSDKRRRQFKQVVLCTLNKLLDEDESVRATKT